MWVTCAYCSICGCGFPVENKNPKDDMHFNVYKVNNDFYCEKCYFEIQQYLKRNLEWEGYLY